MSATLLRICSENAYIIITMIILITGTIIINILKKKNSMSVNSTQLNQLSMFAITALYI